MSPAATTDGIAAAFASSGTVLLHTADTGSALLFKEPLRYISAHTAAEITSTLRAMEAALAQGHHVAGYITYEAGLHLHGVPAHAHPADETLLCFGVYNGFTALAINADPAPASPLDLSLLPSLATEQYNPRIATIQEWIAAGDIYQANLTFPLRAQTTDPAERIYRALLQQQPGPYAAVLQLQPDSKAPTILSFSPELFFRTDAERNILTCPMKGTAVRSGNDDRDAAQLAADPKNRAEHVMIVDLLRNDLGRICQIGSVHTEHLFSIQTLPTVHQMVTGVRGRLRRETTWTQIFQALFPSGSVTGAPKLRAMQRLHQVENEPRGVYTGAIGYIAPGGESSFSVAIRTLTMRERNGRTEVTCGVGGGVVADSTPQGEYNEALLKSAFIRRAARPLELIETVRADGRHMRWLESHLARLERSANALGFPFNRAALLRRLQGHVEEAVAKRGTTAHRVRVVLSQEGHLQFHSEPLQPWPQTLHVRLAPQRSSMGDPVLAHKTNARESYDQAFAAARAEGFHEALFANDAGLLTEGCVTNLFFVRGGRLYTPYVSCGVLPGILRGELLKHRLVEESLLPLDAVSGCEALLLGNSLRGLYPVQSLQLDSKRTLTWQSDVAADILRAVNDFVAADAANALSLHP